MKSRERNNKDLERAIMFNDSVFAIVVPLVI